MKFKVVFLLVLILTFVLLENKLGFGAITWCSSDDIVKKLTERTEEIAGNMKNIAFLLLGLFSTVAIVIAFFKFHNLESYDFYPIITRIVIAFILLAAYPKIVNGVYTIVD